MRKLSLRSKLVLFSCVICLLVAGVSYGVFSFAILKIAENTVYGNLRSLQDEIEDNLRNHFSSIDLAAKYIIVGSTVYEYLQEGAPSYEGDELKQRMLQTGIEEDMTSDLLFHPAFNAGLIENIHLYLTDNNIAFISRNNRATDKRMLSVNELYLSLRGKRFWGMRCYATNSSDPLLYFAYCLYPFSMSSSSRNFYLILASDKDNFRMLFSPILTNDDAIYYLFNQQGKIMACSDPCREGQSVDNELYAMNTHGKFVQGEYQEAQYFISASVMENGLRCVTLLPTTLLHANVREITGPYLILCIVVLTLTVLLVFPTAMSLTHFTNDFLNGIRRLGSGNFSVRLPAYQDHDLNEISRTFNQMTEQITMLIQEKYEKQMLLQQMDIEFLQSQMNPHFIFNVLLSISARAKINKDETLFEMVQALTKLLKASLHQNKQIKIPLKEELEYVYAYLRIQSLRFGQRITYKINVQDGTQALLIPRLSMQPLVENAVQHGLSSQEENGQLWINTYINQGDLIITIEDNGCGFDPEQLTEKSGNGNHIAIVNLRRRIELIYGPSYGLTLCSAPGKGCKVTLHLPVEEGSHELSCNDC